LDTARPLSSPRAPNPPRRVRPPYRPRRQMPCGPPPMRTAHMRIVAAVILWMAFQTVQSRGRERPRGAGRLVVVFRAGPAPESGTAERAGSSALGDAVASFDPSGEEVPWNEPALPMAWPPGVAPSVHAGPPTSMYEEAAEDELVPQPDPSWPRLFGRVPEGQDAA